jgi:hypothetical protein
MLTRKTRSAALTGTRTTGALLAVALLFAAPISGRAQESGFEKFEPRSARDVVSGSLIEGPHYRLAPTVQTFAFQNHFVVSSDYGIFEAKSDTMLRRLVREIDAIGALHDVSVTEAYGKALGQAAMGPVRGVEALIDNPVDTVAAVPSAVFNVFSRAKQGISTKVSGGKTDYEDSAAAQALQMSSYKRDYAKQLGVDPYSSNAVLQKQLGSVAWAAAAGNLTLGAATMASGSSVVAGLSFARNIDQAVNIVAAEPPSELMIRNRAALEKMGIGKDLAERFLAQRQYSPRAKTILIMALSGMTRTAGREAVLVVSLQAPDETTAIFYQQLAELLNAYDARVAAIARLEARRRLVLARRSDGKAVILAALDNVIWNEQIASAARELAQSLQLKPGGDGMEFWITGSASNRFKSEAEALGIRVTEGASKQLTLLD